MANPILAVSTTPVIVTSLYASVAIVGGTGNWAVDDEIEGQTSGAKAIITQIDNPGATQTMHFYYISPFIVFNGSEQISNNTDTGDSTSSGAVTSAIEDLSFGLCRNFKLHPGAQGAVDLKIKVVTGTFQFSVDVDPSAVNPSYAADEVLNIRLWTNNVLKILASAGLSTFEIEI